MATQIVDNCSDCTRKYTITKPAAVCKNVKENICDMRIGCCDELIESIVPSDDLGCEKGYINNIVVDAGVTGSALFAVDVLNPDELDEQNEYEFDDDTDIGEDTYTFGAVKVKVYNPDQECALKSWKGRKMCIWYKIENRSGDFAWRRYSGRLKTVSGSLVAGYELTFENNNPGDLDCPIWVNIGGDTDAALDAVTDFG
jgi:hypothetical protein